jgi:hypothetical protein
VLTVGLIQMTYNPYFQYVLMTHWLGGVALEMQNKPKGRMKLCADRHGMYYDGERGRLYVGDSAMVNEDLLGIKQVMDSMNRPIVDETLGNVSEEARLDLSAIHGPIFKKQCLYCNGFGVFPDDNIPLTEEEKLWTESDSCEWCGSNNWDDYFALTGCATETTPPWDNDTSIGFHAALENFSRSIKCAESSDTPDTKTVPK